ncbi:MAG TPA: DegT/DnrJ/EryC1/StrS family aminotransferase [Dinghuibacter sp.]|jgi:dTDP-4-amino-4,6-dideoxygalactose transaminase|uniref:DegT/DnrJ/EryC1/StrS family aminotransferase n=1 Tax=Dinghuibacter sp. TaxID=2024697 RepID=UPI002B6479FE|nr:DegT/DnrJ/EryC1/StrS family aminotransferase [Dinghuibacter sp.]HTJ10967.1 DegT/DnrJ/EryC1/StrS family aminotransferase [Dinghuibacter sp.]
MRLSKSVLDQREADAVSAVLLKDGYLGMGAEVGRFEQDIAAYIGVPAAHVVCVNSGTAALHLAVAAILVPGDEILVPSLTFLASYQAISATGAIPVHCEIRADTLTLDLKDAAARITERTRAIMPVHYASNPYAREELYSFAREHGLRVIEDAAHAFGCTYDGRKIGSEGDIVCFSFDGIKNITSGEGGAIVTSDQSVLNIVKDTRLLGVEKDSEKRYSGMRSWDFDVTRQGYRYHMSNLFAAIGRVQLSKLDTLFAPKRKALARLYRDLLESHRGVRLQTLEERADIVSHILPIRVLEGKRDGLRAFLEEKGIPTGIHYKPNHLLTFYGGGGQRLPVTEAVYEEILSLPLHPELEEGDIKHIVALINEYLG